MCAGASKAVLPNKSDHDLLGVVSSHERKGATARCLRMCGALVDQWWHESYPKLGEEGLGMNTKREHAASKRLGYFYYRKDDQTAGHLCNSLQGAVLTPVLVVAKKLIDDCQQKKDA
jgi:hypothetical protein